MKVLNHMSETKFRKTRWPNDLCMANLRVVRQCCVFGLHCRDSYTQKNRLHAPIFQWHMLDQLRIVDEQHQVVDLHKTHLVVENAVADLLANQMLLDNADNDVDRTDPCKSGVARKRPYEQQPDYHACQTPELAHRLSPSYTPLVVFPYHPPP